MLEFFDNLLSQMDPLIAYFLLGISAFVENTLPPIPGDTVTVLGAYLVTIGKLNFWGVYISTTIGSIAGFFTMYLIGIIVGRSCLNSKLQTKNFGVDSIGRVENWFARYGYWVIAGNRFLSGTRSVISLFAGLFHLKWLHVLLLSTISALVWNGLLIYAGYTLGVNWQIVTEVISEYNKIVIGLTVIIISIIIFRKWKSSGTS